MGLTGPIMGGRLHTGCATPRGSVRPHYGGGGDSIPPVAAGLSSSPKKSFASLLKNHPASAPSSSSDPPPSPIILTATSYKGELGLKIMKSALDSMSRSFHFTLIGEFSHGRPSMERSRSIFSKLDLKGDVSLGHLDPKLMLI